MEYLTAHTEYRYPASFGVVTGKAVFQGLNFKSLSA